ncbi:hypothetical protein ASE41_38370 [Streptomyces sp. Root264]|nr:hypothetical protein ASE41_38370 [Streptomyces sp. Root264]
MWEEGDGAAPVVDGGVGNRFEMGCPTVPGGSSAHDQQPAFLVDLGSGVRGLRQQHGPRMQQTQREPALVGLVGSPPSGGETFG